MNMGCLRGLLAHEWLKGQKRFSAGFCIARLLRDRDHSVRLYTARLMRVLFEALPLNLGDALYKEIEKRLRVVLREFSSEDEEDETTMGMDSEVGPVFVASR